MMPFNKDKIQIGISSCLLGEKVRYDGGHKNSKYCSRDLSELFKFVPVCPEMAIGLGTPRKTIRLVRDENQIRVLTSDESFDVTEPLVNFSNEKVKQLSALGGYIFCAKSPTCGMERVLEYKIGTNNATKSGVGIFAKALMERYPLLPVEEEGRLHDPNLKENFFTRVYAYHDWMSMKQTGLTRHELIRFHSRYKYLIMAHSTEWYRKLGPILADLSDLESRANEYFDGFMTALKCSATKRSHTNTLQHIQGYFKNELNKEQKAELTESILNFNQGLTPLLVPITLINHYLREHPKEYIQDQVYLNPHPQELKLRYGF
ncbi:DUF1722 domain-containing protein [Shewanella sp. 202IG2-18]|uniref:YbgA family protein n=1 Tax=Parashewanella hymeniacidonis TaxID=2807618 RepID=UPI001960828A|nr:DUF523 and DUF1722 domain-containing protein [Parashewanella hymeniacidonis]MBM7071039.1 DUF1722 domain-containing protein [Parashewanella hymeniacidonis]